VNPTPGALPTYFRNVFEGHVATQYFDDGSREDMFPLLAIPRVDTGR